MDELDIIGAMFFGQVSARITGEYKDYSAEWNYGTGKGTLVNNLTHSGRKQRLHCDRNFMN